MTSGFAEFSQRIGHNSALWSGFAFGGDARGRTEAPVVSTVVPPFRNLNTGKNTAARLCQACCARTVRAKLG